MADSYRYEQAPVRKVAPLLLDTAKIMTGMPHPRSTGAGRRRARRLSALAAASVLILLAAGCGTGHPQPISSAELEEAQTFPYYRVYWVGPTFEGEHLSTADGLDGYIEKVGDSVYYGDCVKAKGIFGGGSCELPLQVTTVVYRQHYNGPLGPQHNILVRGVPAVVYDEGRSIEVYTGQVSIDVFSDTYAHAIRAAEALLPINAPGSASGDLPLPVYCPGLAGALAGPLARVMQSLPGRICQRDAAELALVQRLST